MSEHCGHHRLTGVVGTSVAVCDDCGSVCLMVVGDGPPTSVGEDGEITAPFMMAPPFEEPTRIRMPEDQR